ncbi:Gfo/Idh/MocA family protein [Salinarimonas soli]|uniref:Gfo/Idh/MocA family oxidoreductase n=1 Tax=Salinarimonas soli TaxID=1638099 RepID=A0A5B2VR16_9HYPH|nr:Gfo/Idh/MocA family oxidoreductase [Salinarimonas soli]KAA2241040.1 Gfo/Idh/MocA family oxidoreductase [Salinarimonas soli]
MRAHRIGIVGYGKIAQDQHVPVIKGGDAFVLVAVSSTRGAGPPGLDRIFRDYRDMLAMGDLDAVAICTPPNVRHAIARDALAAGKHVMLEKPPAATLSELEDLARRASAANLTLFTTWHSQANAGVDEARRRLQGQRVRRLAITWREDVRRWHPGQTWIWEAGGFGVFDPGINGLSILTKIFPDPIFVQAATLSFPANADAPIAADLVFSTGRGEEDLRANFDWREDGPQIWDIVVETEAGQTLHLAEGGSRLSVDGREVVAQPPAEYEGLYARFGELINAGTSEVDAAPFRLVADAFMIGRRVQVEPFTE